MIARIERTLCAVDARQVYCESGCEPSWAHNAGGHITWSASSVATPGVLHLSVEALARHGCPALRSNLMPITIPNYSCKTDRHQFGMLIGITSER